MICSVILHHFATGNQQTRYSMYTSPNKLSTFMKAVATFFAICCVFSTSNGAEITGEL